MAGELLREAREGFPEEVTLGTGELVLVRAEVTGRMVSMVALDSEL